MKILYCIPHLFRNGGMERVLTQKANWLSGHGHEVVVVTTESTPEGVPVSYYPLHATVKVKELGIDFDKDFRLSLPSKWIHHRLRQKKYKKALLQYLDNEKPDIVVSLCGKEIEWLGDANLPCRKMAEIHFAIDYRKRLLMQYHSGWFWEKVGDWMIRDLVRSVRNLEALVVLTQNDQNAWEQKGIKHVCCIPNPTDLEPSNIGKHDEKTVLAVGRLHPQKGFDMLLSSWKKVHECFPDWNLRILGEGDSREELTRMCHDLQLSESVRLEGFCSAIADAYRSCGLFVLSSRYEGLPLALIEAMSQGCAIVSFDCPQGPAELITDGVTGRLITAEDTEQLAACMNEMIADCEQRTRLGNAAYEYALSHFAVEPIMKQWLKLFE